MSRRKKTKTTPHVRVDLTASATALARQLENAQHELNVLHARTRAYQARLAIQPGTEHRPHRHDPQASDQELLERLAGALLTAHISSQAITGTPLDDRTTTRSNFPHPLPGSSTHTPRARARELRDAIHTAIDAFEWSAENGWKRRPREDTPVPKLRCRRRDCPAADTWVPAWRNLRGGRTIYHQFCASCGSPLTPPDQEDPIIIT